MLFQLSCWLMLLCLLIVVIVEERFVVIHKEWAFQHWTGISAGVETTINWIASLDAAQQSAEDVQACLVVAAERCAGLDAVEVLELGMICWGRHCCC